MDELIVFAIEDTASWRQGTAKKFPEDKRNIEAANILKNLAPQVRGLEGTALHERLSRLAENDDNRTFSNVLSEHLKTIGFGSLPSSGEELVEELILHLEASFRPSKGIFEAPFGEGAFGLSARRGPTGPPPTPTHVLPGMAPHGPAPSPEQPASTAPKVVEPELIQPKAPPTKVKRSYGKNATKRAHTEKFSTRPAEIREAALNLVKEIKAQINQLNTSKPNDRESLDKHNNLINFLEMISLGLSNLSIAIEKALTSSERGDSEPLLLGTASKIANKLGKDVRDWLERNDYSLVDYTFRVGLFCAGFTFMHECGVDQHIAAFASYFMKGSFPKRKVKQ